MGVKSVLLFSKLIVGKSQVFSARLYVYLHSYAQIRDRVKAEIVNSLDWWLMYQH